jgi:hypothetical protein
MGTTAQAPLSLSGGSVTSAIVPALTNGKAYTLKVKAVNGNGASNASAASAAIIPRNTIFDFGGTPASLDVGDTNSGELGVKFTADAAE